ncbi:MAG: DUF4392 domain-containing protein [Gemmataceae bacterium]|nr:DUF4392 domain-containing protein [Gemmataceae bacterium]MDW8266734.1 DUF4392 domain-containing protein [Gemmataceae bacterium]
MTNDTLDNIREAIQADVGRRGLRTDPKENLITATLADFALACRGLADRPDASVAIVTGFFIPDAEPPCGETDGPLGALYLARALTPLSMRVTLVTDEFCQHALEAGLAACGLRKRVPLVKLPPVHEALAMPADHYVQYVHDRTGPLTHLIALERVGPSHTPESLLDPPGSEAADLERFIRTVPTGHYDRCHTMKGRDITVRMSPAHRLFESTARRSRPLTTIGIGDGGNEIGMGKIPWRIIDRNIPHGGLVACRIPADHLIVCGVSNWGAYGLAAGVYRLRGQSMAGELADVEKEYELLRVMVENGPLVDGVTGQATVSVDGLPFRQYAEVLERVASVG